MQISCYTLYENNSLLPFHSHSVWYFFPEGCGLNNCPGTKRLKRDKAISFASRKSACRAGAPPDGLTDLLNTVVCFPRSREIAIAIAIYKILSRTI